MKKEEGDFDFRRIESEALNGFWEVNGLEGKSFSDLHPKHISLQKYFQDIDLLCQKVRTMEIDCIVCLKRSGMMVGAFISFQLNIPLFTTSEIGAIPEKFKNVLLVDDKTYSGKSMRHWYVKLLQVGKNTTTASVYLQQNYKTDVFACDLGCQHTMFYEL